MTLTATVHRGPYGSLIIGTRGYGYPQVCLIPIQALPAVLAAAHRAGYTVADRRGTKEARHPRQGVPGHSYAHQKGIQ